MRLLLTCLLIGCAGPAQAMNWEGHDDWMADTGPALDYEQSAPHAVLLPDPARGCVTARPETRANPYEQIPLKRRDCRAPEEPSEPGR